LNKNNGLLDLLTAEKLTEISLQREQIWNVDHYSSLLLNCDNEYFLETLLSNIKGSVISFQSWVKTTENKEKSAIISRLNVFKKNYDNNCVTTAELENHLKAILDKETLLKV
jgi:hypothetical protein